MGIKLTIMMIYIKYNIIDKLKLTVQRDRIFRFCFLDTEHSDKQILAHLGRSQSCRSNSNHSLHLGFVDITCRVSRFWHNGSVP